MAVDSVQASNRGIQRRKITGRWTLNSGSWINFGNFSTPHVGRDTRAPWVPMGGRYASSSTQKVSASGPDPYLTPP